MLPKREELLARALMPLPKEEVAIPEWGEDCFVWVRGLTALERDRWEVGNYDLSGAGTRVTMDNARARLAVCCIVDDNGNRIFRDEDAAAFGRLHSAPLDRIYDVCRRLSGMTPEEREEIRKNSPNGQADGSHADLPSVSGTSV